jgi:hypothetical protein
MDHEKTNARGFDLYIFKKGMRTNTTQRAGHYQE